MVRSACDRRQFWTPIGRQTMPLGRSAGYKSLGNLVGLPGFEPGTSCTPSTRPASTGHTASGVFYGLHGFGASASAHRRWRWIEFLAHFCARRSRMRGRVSGIDVARVVKKLATRAGLDAVKYAGPLPSGRARHKWRDCGARRSGPL